MALNKFRSFAIVLAILVFPIAALALPATWQIVPATSTIVFTATQNGAPVMGSFKKFTGDIQFDPSDLNNSKAQIVIDMNSVSTAYSEVAETLKTADWFDVKRYPKATFTINEFTKTSDNSYQARGNLTIRDKTVPITLNFTAQQNSPTQAHAEGSTLIKRTAFGVGQGDWANTDQVKDEVMINFKLDVVKK